MKRILFFIALFAVAAAPATAQWGDWVKQSGYGYYGYGGRGYEAAAIVDAASNAAIKVAAARVIWRGGDRPDGNQRQEQRLPCQQQCPQSVPQTQVAPASPAYQCPPVYVQPAQLAPQPSCQCQPAAQQPADGREIVVICQCPQAQAAAPTPAPPAAKKPAAKPAPRPGCPAGCVPTAKPTSYGNWVKAAYQ